MGRSADGKAEVLRRQVRLLCADSPVLLRSRLDSLPRFPASKPALSPACLRMQTSARLLLALNCFLVSFPRLACPATMLPLAAVRSRVPLAFCRFNWCRVGRAGPKVYGSWAECKAAVTGFPRAEFKSFPTYEEASRFALGGSALRAFHSSSTASAAAASSKDPAATRAFPEEKKVEVDMAARATTTFAVGKTPAKPGTEKSCVVYFDGGSRGNPGHAG